MTRTSLRLLVLSGVGAAALCTACGVKNPYEGAVLKTEIPDSGGSYVAGTDIRQGTWRFANAAAHPAGERCAWTVSATAGKGGWIVIQSSADDTDNAVQNLYLVDGMRLEVSHCGKGGWLSADDQTWPAEPEPAVSTAKGGY